MASSLRDRLIDSKQYVCHSKQICLILLLFFIGFVPFSRAQSPSGLTLSVQYWKPNLPSNFVSANGYYALDPAGGACTTTDVNGDGAIDIVCVNQGSGNGSPTGAVANLPSSAIVMESTKGNLATSGFSTSTEIGNVSADVLGNIATCAGADFDGDGRGDLSCFYFQTDQSGGEGYGYPETWFSNAGGPLSLGPVSDSTTAIPVVESLSGQNTWFNGHGVHPFGTSCTVGHFMAGPGQEILCNYPRALTTAQTNIYYLWRFSASFSGASGSGNESITQTGGNKSGTGIQWTGPTHILTWGRYANFGSNCQAGDFNGDGLTDVACPDGNGNWNMGISTGTSFAVQTWSTNDAYHKDCATGDFNGDGKTDIVCYVDGASNPIRVYLSTGSGFRPNQTWNFPGLPAAQNPDGTNPRDNSVFSTICSMADLNGDGKTDLMCYSGSGSNWIYGLSTGSGFTIGNFAFFQPPTIPAPLSDLTSTNTEPFVGPCILGDFLGTGLADILCYPGGGNGPQPFIVGVMTRN